VRHEADARTEKNLAGGIEVSQETVEDREDLFTENLCTALFLLLGTLAVFASVVLLAYPILATVYSQQLAMSISTRSIFAAFLLVVGLGSLHLFRKRRRLRKEKTSSLFYRVR